jgi:hypothetical protein
MCPLCGDYRGDDLCHACYASGHTELGCGCLELADGRRVACSPKHELCDACGTQEKQATADLCGDCISLAEMEAQLIDRYLPQSRSQWETARR